METTCGKGYSVSVDGAWKDVRAGITVVNRDSTGDVMSLISEGLSSWEQVEILAISKGTIYA